MALATFDNAPFEPLVDPTVGIALGHSWGESVELLLENHPHAQLVEDEADIQEYVIPYAFGFCSLETHAFFRYQLDSLVAISLRWGLTEQALVDAPCARCIAGFVDRYFIEELVESDQGYFHLEQETTRLSVDWMEQQLMLEEIL